MTKPRRFRRGSSLGLDHIVSETDITVGGGDLLLLLGKITKVVSPGCFH